MSWEGFKKHSQGCRPLKKSVIKGGVRPVSICWHFRQKGQRTVLFGANNFRECPPRWGDTNLLFCNADFFGVSEIAFLNPFPKWTLFFYLVGPLSTTSLRVSLYLVKCSSTKFYKNNFWCLPLHCLFLCVLIENLTRTSLKSRQGFSSPIMLNTAMSFNMNICSYLDQHENVLIIRIEWMKV